MEYGKMECLIPRGTIARRVETLALEIQRSYAPGTELLLAVLLNGGMVFAADLMRAMTMALTVDTLAAASYEGRRSTGRLVWRAPLKMNPAGRHILVVDDILDSGLTLKRVLEHLRSAGATSVRSCVLLDKDTARHPEGLAHADYTGFRIPDRFVVGYGLDAEEKWRNLPDVMVLPDAENGDETAEKL